MVRMMKTLGLSLVSGQMGDGWGSGCNFLPFCDLLDKTFLPTWPGPLHVTGLPNFGAADVGCCYICFGVENVILDKKSLFD